MEQAHLFAIGVLLAWLAGIRVYLTVFGVGLAGFFGWLQLPEALQATQSPWVLGVSGAGVFFRVTLPLAWRGIMAGVLLAFARALGEFGATLMVAGSIPGKTQTLSIAVYEAVQAGQDDTANLLVLITSALCITVLLLAGRLAPGRIANR